VCNINLPTQIFFNVCVGFLFFTCAGVSHADWKISPCTLQDAYFRQYSSFFGSNITAPNPLACSMNEARASKNLESNKGNRICTCQTTNYVSGTNLSNFKEFPSITEMICYRKTPNGSFQKKEILKTWMGYVRPSPNRKPEEAWTERSKQCEKERLISEKFSALEICTAWINTVLIPENWRRYVGISSDQKSQAIQLKNINSFVKWNSAEESHKKIFDSFQQSRAGRENLRMEVSFLDGKISEVKIQQQFTTASPLHLFDVSAPPKWTKVSFNHSDESCNPVSVTHSDQSLQPNPLNISDCFNKDLRLTLSHKICETIAPPYFLPKHFTNQQPAKPGSPIGDDNNVDPNGKN
jgi:hypothetical protein